MTTKLHRESRKVVDRLFEHHRAGATGTAKLEAHAMVVGALTYLGALLGPEQTIALLDELAETHIVKSYSAAPEWQDITTARDRGFGARCVEIDRRSSRMRYKWRSDRYVPGAPIWRRYPAALSLPAADDELIAAIAADIIRAIRGERK